MVLNNEHGIESAEPLAAVGLNAASRVLIVGLGKTGFSVARFLSGRGISCSVTDDRETPPMMAEFSREVPGAPVYLGRFDAAAFAAATHVVVSPGVSLSAPEVRAARAKGTPLLSDIDLFACAAHAPVLAITGSNGKSTVTTLVGQMAEASGRRVRVGGNLGTPALDLLDDTAELYVLELSSFQLERTSHLRAAAATVLNISADHMDRYPDLKAYAEAKARIFEGDGLMVLNADDPMVAAMASPARRTVRFGMHPRGGVDYGVCVLGGVEWMVRGDAPLMRTEELRIKGRHNVANALAALALGDAAGLPATAMCAALQTFSGLDHRMQWVAESAGVGWYNDSKATNIGACIAALEGIAGKVVLIAGGDGKGADFAELAPAVTEKARAVVLIGRDAQRIADALPARVPTRRAGSMQEAVEFAHALAVPGDTVLLAPACSSLDQYRDYQERGQVFVEAVRRVTA